MLAHRPLVDSEHQGIHFCLRDAPEAEHLPDHPHVLRDLLVLLEDVRLEHFGLLCGHQFPLYGRGF